MTLKPVDINQRIPLSVLEIALLTFLDGAYDESYIVEQLRLEYNGENRIKKSLRIVNKIVPKCAFSTVLMENADIIRIAMKNRSDRNVILISLLNSAFGFSYDTLDLLARIFNAQDTVNSETVLKSLSKSYGGNRSTVNAMYSVLPMFVEAEFLIRPKTGLYESNGPIAVSSEITNRLYVLSFCHQKGLLLTNVAQLSEPYLNFVRN